MQNCILYSEAQSTMMMREKIIFGRAKGVNDLSQMRFSLIQFAKKFLKFLRFFKKKNQQ